MATVQPYMFLLVLLVSYRLTYSQPTSSIFCSMFCGGSDESIDDSDDYDFSIFDLFGVCSLCDEDKESNSEEVTTTTKAPTPQPVKIMIPPANGLNLTVFSNIGGVLMDLVPWLASPTTAAPAAATTAAATTAGNGSDATTAATTKKA